jgi:DNA-binding protein HU-beta
MKPAVPAATGKKASAPTVPMSKLVAELADKHDMPKKAVAAVFDDFVDLTVKNLKKGNKVRLTGLGILQVRKRAARMGRNPATGEAIKIKASKKVAFRVAKDLKQAI